MTMTVTRLVDVQDSDWGDFRHRCAVDICSSSCDAQHGSKLMLGYRIKYHAFPSYGWSMNSSIYGMRPDTIG